MSFYIVKGNILERNVDAIVVSVAPNLSLDRGHLQKKLKTTCGKRIQYELNQLQKIGISECVIVNAYNLPCKRIILAASPKEIDGKDEQENLENTYINCLDLAVSFGLSSIDFCLLSAGTYDMKKRKAIEIAINTITDYIKDVDISVGLVIYEKDTFNNYRDMFKGYEIIPGKLADKEEMKEMLEERKRENGRLGWYRKRTVEILENGPESKEFKEKLEYFMTSYGLTELDCYNGVVSKAMFYNYLKGAIPKKDTVVALGINMGLNLWDIIELLHTIDESLIETIDRDQIIINGILNHKEIEDINKDLELINSYPLPTNKSAE